MAPGRLDAWHRPVLGNDRLKARFGYLPRLTSREVFELYRTSRRS